MSTRRLFQKLLLSTFFFLLFPISAQAGHWDAAMPGGSVLICGDGIACARAQQQATYGNLINKGPCYPQFNSSGALASTVCTGYTGGGAARFGYASLRCDAGEYKTAVGCVEEPPAEKERQCASEAGNPTDLRSGMKIADALDFATAGQQPLTLQRTYSSDTGYLFGENLTHTRLGRGWRTNYDSATHFVGTASPTSRPAQIHIVLPNGTYLSFGRNSTGYVQEYLRWSDKRWRTGFVSTRATLVRNTVDNQFEVTTSDDTVWVYDYDGNLTSATYRSGYSIDFEYDINGNNSAVEDSFGRRIEFTYSGTIDGLLVSAEMPDGEVYRYEYDLIYDAADLPGVTDQNDISLDYRVLTSVIYPDDTPLNANDNPRLTYHYENTGFPAALTGITDEENIRYATWTYDTAGRVLTSVHAGNVDDYAFSYDDVNDTVTVTNPLTKQAIYQFETDVRGHRRLTGIDGQASANCVASTRSISYDTNNFIDERIDEEGRATAYVRDTRGLPTSITEASGTPDARVRSMTWDPTFEVVTQIIETGLTTDLTYDTTGRVTLLEQTDTTSHTVPYSSNGETRNWAFTYTTSGLLATVDGPLAGAGDTVTYAYDLNGYVSSITDELGHITQITSVNGRGQPTQMQDPNGVVTQMTYNLRGWLTGLTVDPGVNQAVTSFIYDDIGQVTTITRPDSSTLDFAYDNARRLTSITNAAGEKLEYTHDDMGGVTRRVVKDAGGTIEFDQQHTFDELGRFLSHIGASTQTTTYGYDKVGNLTSITDPRSNLYAMGYDRLNRLVTETNQDTAVTTYAYDERDGMVSYEDPRTITTTYVRNGFGDVIREDNPDTGITDYVVNTQGLVTQMTDARGIVTNFTYDEAGRVLTKTFPANTGENVTYTYDSVAGGNFGKGRLTQLSDESGTTDFVYDARGNVLSETRTIQTQSYVTTYTYDLTDQIASVTYPSGRIVTYTRNGTGRVSDVATQQNSGATSVDLASYIEWQPMSGIVQSFDYGNGLNLWRTFTDDYQLDQLLIENLSTSTTILQRWHVRSDDMNLTNIWDGVTPANDQSFWYTASNRLQNADGPWGDLTFQHDDVGNRTFRTLDNGTVTTHSYGYFGGDNRLVDVMDGSTVIRAFTYTANGSVATDDRGGTVHSYTYNDANRLKTVTIGGVLEGTYTYNGLEQLVIRDLPTASPARVVHSIYDRNGNLIAEADGATGTTVREYIWLEEHPWLDDSGGLPDSMPLAVVADVDTVSPVLWYIHADHLNRPIAVTDTAGVPVSEAWLPFGDASGTSILNARFPGQWFQSENGLHYNWHRHYDPTTGRYTQADPLGFVDGPSLYAYALNSPQMYTDPSGLAVCGGLCIAALAYGGFEAASFLYDLYNLADTLTDSCSSGSDIAIASGGLALGIIAPGGGYGTLGRGVRNLPVRFDSDFATKQLLGTTTTPSGRKISFHAADRMVNPPRGRSAMSPSQVDSVLDGATNVRRRTHHAQGDTLTIQNRNMPGNPQVVVDAETGRRVVTVVNPK
ncbi:RHS repeat-associated core domain-containing protein [Pyruvatibacter sp.]|uniref:RHS repeat-associated core domain-containing protein n=1 Tax=Pyruvatibacter sp. TaxID=1981328 RepID=UPI003263E848